MRVVSFIPPRRLPAHSDWRKSANTVGMERYVTEHVVEDVRLRQVIQLLRF